MSPLPNYRPKKLSLGPLEREILEIIWEKGGWVTVKDVHGQILSDPSRELAYASVTTILRRLTDKGWLTCQKKHLGSKAFAWRALISRSQAQAIQAYNHLHEFLAIGNPDVVASFADSLDTGSLEQIQAIASRLQALRQEREEK